MVPIQTHVFNENVRRYNERWQYQQQLDNDHAIGLLWWHLHAVIRQQRQQQLDHAERQRLDAKAVHERQLSEEQQKHQQQREQRLDADRHAVEIGKVEVDRIRAESELAGAQARLTAAQSQRGETAAPRPAKRARTAGANAPVLRNRFNVSHQILRRVMEQRSLTGDCDPALLKEVYGLVHDWVAQHKAERRLDVFIQIMEADVYVVYAWPKGRVRGFQDETTEELWNHVCTEMQLPVAAAVSSTTHPHLPPATRAHRLPRFTPATWAAYCQQADARSNAVMDQLQERAQRSRDRLEAEEQRRTQEEIWAIMR